MSRTWKQVVVASALILALGLSFERTAYAYVDPGSSLLAYQSFSAVATGVLFYFRHRLKSLFRKRTNSADAGSGENR